MAEENSEQIMRVAEAALAEIGVRSEAQWSETDGHWVLCVPMPAADADVVRAINLGRQSVGLPPAGGPDQLPKEDLTR